MPMYFTGSPVVDLAAFLSDQMPAMEGVQAASGSAPKASRNDHVHERPVSATQGVLGADNRATVAFTRTFDKEPTITMMYEEASATALPVLFRVDSFVKVGSIVTGCIVRGFRTEENPELQPLNPLALLGVVTTGVNNVVTALSKRSNVGGSVAGVKFYCTAIARTD